MLSLEYVAGLFDGEGCVTIYKMKSSYCRGWNYVIQITISNTYKPVIDILHHRFGGGIRMETRRNRNLVYCHNIKTLYQFRLTKQSKMLSFLHMIYPFLIIKKVKVGLIIEFLEILSNIPRKYPHKKGKEGMLKGPQKIYPERLHEIFKEIKRK